MAVSDYSTTPGSNTAISGINIAEGCSPANINDAIRQMMADVKTLADGLDVGSDVQAYNANLASLSGLTLAANKMLYATAANTLALTDLTAAGRALLDDADASAQRSTLGLGTAAVASLIDDDTFATATASNVASAESTKAYVDAVNQVRAWVNFNGTGTVAIRAAYGVSSITDNGTGDYTVNFTGTFVDADYAVSFGLSDLNWGAVGRISTQTTTTLRFNTLLNQNVSAAGDPSIVCVTVIR